jgi:hypothetical protein
MLRREASILQQEIANLCLQYPELRDDEVMRVDMLEGSTNLKELLTAINRGLEDAKALRDGTALRLAELTERKRRFERRADFLRDMILKILLWADLKKIELPEATLSLRAGAQKVIGEPDADKLPDEFVRIIREPLRAKIREAMLAGTTFEGCALSNAEPSLSIHTK